MNPNRPDLRVLDVVTKWESGVIPVRTLRWEVFEFPLCSGFLQKPQNVDSKLPLGGSGGLPGVFPPPVAAGTAGICGPNQEMMNFTNRFSQCLEILYGSFLFVDVLRL